MVVQVDPLDVRIDAAVNLAGEPRDSVHFDGVRPRTIASTAPGVDGDALPSARRTRPHRGDGGRAASDWKR